MDSKLTNITHKTQNKVEENENPYMLIQLSDACEIACKDQKQTSTS